MENRNGFFFLFFTRFFRGPERTHNRNGSFFLFFTRFLGDLSELTTETVPFFFLHTFFRGPVIFSIEKFGFVCLETVLKFQNPMFLGQLIVVELLSQLT